ncbi:PERM1 protein, partial [Penelope pileata]|nr:PERM1 protein [Penelope pileata]
MDNFEYSLQLNDRAWADFLQAAEECALTPAALATAEQCLSDIEQGDGGDTRPVLRAGSEPAPGEPSCSPRGLSGADEDGAELQSPGGFLGGSQQLAAMPSVQGGQPRPPAAGSTPGQDAVREVEEGAARTPAAPGGDGSTEQPHGAGAQGGDTERKALSGAPGPRCEPPPSPAAEAAPSGAARRPELGGTARGDPGSIDVVRPKVPAPTRKSRKQRGAGATEGTSGDREVAGSPAQGSAAPSRAPSSSPVASRKSRGKEKAAKAAAATLEEAAESRQVAGSPGAELGEVSSSILSKQRVKEPGAQSPGKARATRTGRQGGGSGVLISASTVVTTPAVVTPPVVATPPAVVTMSVVITTPGASCWEEKALSPQSRDAACGGAAWGGHREPIAEPPRAVSPPRFAVGSPTRTGSLDVTWPELCDYLFCDPQSGEEVAENSLEGEKTPLEREISLPELYEHFFNEPEGSRKKVKERKRKKSSSLDHAEPHSEHPALAAQPPAASIPELYEHFFPDGPRSRGGWRGSFFSVSASEVRKAMGALKAILQRPKQRGRSQEPISPLLGRRGSQLALMPLGGGPERPPALDMALALRGGPEAPLALTHKDMCLVFCAFASWAVKTSDLQAPDAWKTVFLASFGTLSAIRYFRRQVREGQPRT